MRLYPGRLGTYLLFAFASIASGQTTSELNPSEADLYLSLFRHQHFLTQELARNSTSAATMEESIARHFRLSLSDFRQIRSEYSAMATALAALDKEALGYVTKKRSYASVSTLAALEDRRKRMIVSGLTSLRSRMSEQGWSEIAEYVNTKIRPNTVTRKVHQR